MSIRRYHYRHEMIECHFCRSMDKYRGMVDMFACIERPIYAINCILLDCYSVLADLGNYIGTVGMNSCVTMALDLWPTAMLANLLQSRHRSLSWLCLKIWWNLLCDAVEWTTRHGRIVQMELCNVFKLGHLDFRVKKKRNLHEKNFSRKCILPVGRVMSVEILHNHFEYSIRVSWVWACITHWTTSAIQILPHNHWHLPYTCEVQ